MKGMEASTHTVRIDENHRLELVLPDLPEGALVSVTVEPVFAPDPTFRRQPGSAAGRIRIMPNFEDPLEEFEADKY